jgi:hypothetical protein
MNGPIPLLVYVLKDLAFTSIMIRLYVKEFHCFRNNMSVQRYSIQVPNQVKQESKIGRHLKLRKHLDDFRMYPDDSRKYPGEFRKYPDDFRKYPDDFRIYPGEFRKYLDICTLYGVHIEPSISNTKMCIQQHAKANYQ